MTQPTIEAILSGFATAIGKDVEAVKTALQPLVGECTEETVELLANADDTPDADIKAAFTGVPVAKLNKAIRDHFRAKPEAPAVASAQAAPVASFDALPQVPDDGSWLMLLTTSAELKVDPTTVLAAVRAAIAGRHGVYDVLNLLAAQIEAHSVATDVAVPDLFWKLQKQIFRANYGEIFAAMDITGDFMTQERKSDFITRLDNRLWPALIGFQSKLKGWMDSWQAGSSNPAAMFAVLNVALAGSGSGLTMPPGTMQPPNTDGLREAAEGINLVINGIFSGTGIAVARALAYEAHGVKEVLENSQLPMMVGAKNREQVLKQLGVAVTADYVRMERNITRFVLAILELPKVTAGNAEIAYVSSLVQLGNQIPWDNFQVSARPMVNSPRRSAFA